MQLLIIGASHLSLFWNRKPNSTRRRALIHGVWMIPTSEWFYYYRAVDKFGNFIDCYRNSNREEMVAKVTMHNSSSSMY